MRESVNQSEPHLTIVASDVDGFFLSALKVTVTAVQTPSPQTRSQSQDKGQWLSCDIMCPVGANVAVDLYFLHFLLVIHRSYTCYITLSTGCYRPQCADDHS